MTHLVAAASHPSNGTVKEIALPADPNDPEDFDLTTEDVERAHVPASSA